MLLTTAVAAAAVGLALALYLGLERAGRAAVPLALMRAAAWGSVALLLLNPACERMTAGGATVLLDASASMSEATGRARWDAALDSARAIAGRRGRVVLFGGEPRQYHADALPHGDHSRLLPALVEAAGRGGPIAIVTDGEVEDATSLPTDVLRSARVVLISRPARPDAGVAALDIPAAVRAGDTVAAVADIVISPGTRSDSITLAVRYGGRSVARERFAAPAPGLSRRTLRFVPSQPSGESEVRLYEAALTDVADDAEPRNDSRSTAVTVARSSGIVLVSDAPDWDFRWLTASLAASSNVPVRAFVRVARGGPWRDARTLVPVGDAVVRAEAARAAFVVVHGTSAVVPGLAASSKAAWLWPSGAGVAGDWYPQAPERSSPVGGAVAAVPVESLPPLESVREMPEDTTGWTAMAARLDRRGQARPIVRGAQRDGRREVEIGGSGLWRWASRGGVPAEGYRALVASLADWLLEEQRVESAGIASLRDSLARSGQEFLPRAIALSAQPGATAEPASGRAPLRHVPWAFAVALFALVLEWVARRRGGLR